MGAGVEAAVVVSPAAVVVSRPMRGVVVCDGGAGAAFFNTSLITRFISGWLDFSFNHFGTPAANSLKKVLSFSALPNP